MVEIIVSDEIGPMLERTLAHNKDYQRKMLKSFGYVTQKKIKEEVVKGAPGGEQFKERIPYKVRKAVGGSAAKKWYGKMRKAIGYAYRDNGVDIGWTSRTAAKYGEIQEHGKTYNVTESVRNRWEAAGYPLSGSTTELHVPQRPIFEPMASVVQEDIKPFAEQKMREYMEENVIFAKRSRRKYRVY